MDDEKDDWTVAAVSREFCTWAWAGNCSHRLCRAWRRCQYAWPGVLFSTICRRALFGEDEETRTPMMSWASIL